jgi:hypothetical protein
MVQLFLDAGTVVVLMAAVYLSYRCVQLYQEAKANARKINYVRGELKRALDQIASADDNQKLVGLQTLAALNDPTIRAEAFPQVALLSRSEDPQINALANAALDKMTERHQLEYQMQSKSGSTQVESSGL